MGPASKKPGNSSDTISHVSEDILTPGKDSSTLDQDISIKLSTGYKPLEETLPQSETKKLRMYIESAPIGIYLHDLKGKFLYGNKKAEEIIGYKREELIGKSFLKLNLLSAEYQAKAHNILELNSIGRATGPDEFELIRKDNSRVWVEITTTPMWRKGKAVVIGSVCDITERKQAEYALRQSEQNFRNSLDRSPLGVVISTLDGDILYANKAFLDIWGYNSIKELKTAPVEKIYTPHALVEYRKRDNREERVKDINEVDIIRKDGQVRHLTVSRKEVIWGGETQYQTLYQDITDKKRMEEALRESEQNFRNSLDSSPMGIIISSTEGEIVYANQAILDIYGYSNI
jgi:PAS domain S-box-containing protein